MGVRWWSGQIDFQGGRGGRFQGRVMQRVEEEGENCENRIGRRGREVEALSV